VGDAIELSMADLREVTAFAARSAADVLAIFAADRPDDSRPAEAVAAAWEFARGGRRGKALRDTAWAAMRAAKEAGDPAAHAAAMAAMSAAGAAYLHPLANATQVKHILGSAAYAALATELAGGGSDVTLAARRATPVVVDVLRRFPPAPDGGGRAGELVRQLDRAMRH
jgi:hypothetical protein